MIYKIPRSYQIYRFNLGGSPILVETNLTKAEANIKASSLRKENNKTQYQVWSGNRLRSSFGLTENGKPVVTV